MLTSMRKGAGSWVAKGFLGLLVMSFAVWGIQGYVGGGGEVTVAEVGGVEVSGTEYRRQLRRDMRRLQSQFGQVISPEQARALGVYESSLQQLISGLVIDHATDDLGLGVADDVIAQEIRTNPAFRGLDGRFDRLRFDQVLSQNGLSEQGYVAVARRDLVRRQLIGSVLVGVDSAPDVLVNRVFRYRQEARIAEYLVLANDRVDDVDEPDETALAAFHEENEARFTAPAYRALSYITLAPADLVDQVHVSDGELRDEYDARIDEFVQPELRQISQIVFNDEGTARLAYDRLQAGEALTAVAKEMLGLDGADLSLGQVGRDDLPAGLAEVAFGAGKGEVTNPAKSDFGWHVMKIGEIQPGGTRTFEDVKEELRSDVQIRLAGELLFDRANELEDALAGGASLEEAAQRAELSIKRIDAVDQRGRGVDGQAIADLPTIAEFVRTAFAAGTDAELELNESDTGSYFLIRVDRITEPRLKPLAEVRDAVAAGWRAGQQDAATAELARHLVERIKGGEGLPEISAELGAPVVRSQPIIRSGRGDPALPAALQAALFELDVGGAAAAADGLGGAHVVARLAEIRAADPQADANLADRMSQQLANAIAGDLLRQYQDALEANVGVTIDRQALAISTASN